MPTTEDLLMNKVTRTESVLASQEKYTKESFINEYKKQIDEIVGLSNKLVEYAEKLKPYLKELDSIDENQLDTKQKKQLTEQLFSVYANIQSVNAEMLQKSTELANFVGSEGVFLVQNGDISMNELAEMIGKALNLMKISMSHFGNLNK